MTQKSKGFVTERLQVASWKSALKEGAPRQKLVEELAIILTPDVLRYLPLPLHMPGGPQTIDRWISARDGESDVFTIRKHGPSALIGLLILAPFQEPDATRTVHLGYLFADHAWGKGFATELLHGLVAAQIEQGGPAKLLAGVGKGNAASAMVLLKSGFRLAVDLSNAETDMFRRDI